jgi:hypothetical protein
MEAENINLVIITSVIHFYHPSVYSPEERLFQLTNKTIKSIKEKIPNPYIVVLEGGKLNKQEKNILKQSKIDELLHHDVSTYNKSGGELMLLGNYFFSNYFENLKNKKNIETISKISGRYFFTDNFNFYSHLKDDIVVKKIDKTYWSNQGIFETRYYRFPYSYVEMFKKKLQEILINGLHIDIEHSFYKYEVFPFEKIQETSIMNVAGNIAPDGKAILD